MIYSIALTEDINNQLLQHLLREDEQEDLCFALWNPSNGANRKTALISKIILPNEKERSVHGNASFLPAYFERALGEALEANSGLVFLHSHLGPGWQDMSENDVKAELSNASAVAAATGLPFVGLTLGTDGSWSGRFWENLQGGFKRMWCQTVRVIGEHFNLTFMDYLYPVPELRAELKEVISPWESKKQAKISRLTVGIIGTGSVGSIIGETLARLGIQHMKLLDFDSVEYRNLGRILHATTEDVIKNRSKVSVLSEAYKKIAIVKNPVIDALEWSVVEEQGFREALDCDILFSCVDRPWPRAVLNLIAYAHLIPVIDGGIAANVDPASRELLGADWKAHLVGFNNQCLECLGQYNPGLVSTERDGYLDDPRYIQTLPPNNILRQNENVFAFSLGAASLQMQQFLSFIISPQGISNVGQQNYHFMTGKLDIIEEAVCKMNCFYPSFLAKGDQVGFRVTGKHKKAEKERESRKS